MLEVFSGQVEHGLLLVGEHSGSLRAGTDGLVLAAWLTVLDGCLTAGDWWPIWWPIFRLTRSEEGQYEMQKPPDYADSADPF